MKTTIFLLSAFALVASGCSVTSKTNAAGGGCKTNSDCDATLVCAANVCTATATAGGADGGSDGTADGTATSGASSSAGAGSSAGSSSSAGSGSTTGGGALLRAVNADSSSGAVDFCAKGTTTADYAAVISNVAYPSVAAPAASDYVSVPTDTKSIRVVGTGTGCATPLGTFTDLTVDLSNTDNHYTVVADGLSSKLVLATNVPSTASTVGVEVVNASDSNLTVVSPVPHVELATALAKDSVVASSVASFSGLALEVSGLSAASVTPGTTGVALNSRVTIVLMGTAGDPQALVCDDATAANCKVSTLSATALNYLRFANMNDTNTSSLDVCLRAHGGTYGTPIFSAVAQYTTTNYVAIPVAATDIIYVAHSATPATACSGTILSATGELQLGAGDLVGGQTTTVEASDSDDDQFYETDLSTVAAGKVLVTTANSEDFGSVDVTIPALYGTSLGTSPDEQVDVVSLPFDVLQSANGQIVRTVSSGHPQTDVFDYTMTLPATLDAAVSIFLTASTIVVCDDNGTNSCVVGATTASPVNIVGYVRFANFTGGTVSLCNGTSAFTDVPTVANNTTTSFLPVDLSGGSTVSIGYGVADCTAPTAVSLTFDPSEVDYATVVASTSLKATAPAPAAFPPSGEFEYASLDDWSADVVALHLSSTLSIPLSSLGGEATPIQGDVPATIAFSVSDTTHPADNATYATPSNPPARDRTFFSALLGPSAAKPNLLWCDNQLLSGGNSVCQLLIAQ